MTPPEPKSARHLALSFAALIAASSVQPATAQESGVDPAALLSTFADRVETLRAELIDVRRDLHRHPEISGQEERTAGIVADRLRALGYDVTTGVGGHGVVGVLRGGSGPTIAFRADMDAVRSAAPDPVEFASETPGVRHICGHDIHTTIGLALAEGFAAVRDDLAGSVMLIFQPAEEAAIGARAMLEAGVFNLIRPDAVLAYHTAPLEVGQIATAREAMMPGRDGVRVTVRGTGDLEAVAGHVRTLLDGAATIPPAQAVQPATGDFVLVQGARAFRDGSGWAAAATFTTSTREASRQAREAIEAGLAELRRDGVELTLDYDERRIAGVTNTPELVAATNSSAMAVLGETAVLDLTSMTPMFSEDFGSFQEEVPGVMYFIGVSNAERGWVGMPHSPGYVADEEAIFVGARTMGAIFFDLFEDGVPATRR